MRVFAVSDLHVDYRENEKWVMDLSDQDYRDDILIVAGDISDRVPLFKKILKSLAGKFKSVCFIPGNHDLWTVRNGIADSIKKFQILEKVAGDCHVETGRVSYMGLDIYPVFGWYDYSFGKPGGELIGVWRDFTHCTWPDSYMISDINDFFSSKNEYLEKPVQGRSVITFSHFLPRIDIMPPFIPPGKRFLYPVLGSNYIDERARSLDSTIHIYGHSHVNREVRKNGVLYINNAYGYPSEYHITTKKLLKILEL